MPPKTESAPTARRHFKITGFDEAPVREALKNLRETIEEIKDVEELQEQLQKDIPAQQKKTKFKDKQALDVLATLKTKLDLCPSKLAELDQRLEAAQAEMREICSGDKFKLASAISALAGHEARRIEKELVAGFLPHCADEDEAKELAQETQRYVAAQHLQHGWSFHGGDYSRAVQFGLDIFDRYEETGSLETAK